MQMTDLPENIVDQVLWNKIKTGNKSCFNELFRRYYSELYYYGIKIFSDSDFIKECIQEVFVRIWETRENLSDVQNLKSYLLVSLRRKILTAKERNMHRVEIGDIETGSFIFEENEFEQHEEISNEIRKILLKAVNSLTRKQRELIILFFYHELSYHEIAQVIGISVPAVRNLMYRTLVHLREILGEKSLKSMRNMFFLLFSSILIKKAD